MIKFVNYKEDWDWLVILDACRYDFFIKNWEIGKIDYRLSLASDTLGTLRRFPKLEDSILITGHPFPLLFKHKFTKVVDVGFDYRLSTCPPWFINNYVLKNIRLINKFKRKILWYLQPHHPYIGETKLDIRIYEDPVIGKMTPIEKTIELMKRAKQDGILEKAYEDNLKLVLHYVKELLPLMKGRVVITSDHGEGLGKPLRDQDKPIFSHPDNRFEWEVRLIPYCIID